MKRLFKDIIVMILLAIITSGCSGKKGYIKYSKNHPEILANDCMEKFPPKTEFRPGRIDTVPGETILVKGDSIPCPDGTKVKAPDKPVICPPSFVCYPDTIIRVDSAALFLLGVERLKVHDRNNTIIEKQNQIKDLKKDKILLTLLSVVLFGLGCLLAFLWIRK